MTPLMVQGLFHGWLMVAFFLVAVKMWFSFKRTGSYLAKYMLFSFLFASIEYLFFVINIFFFPTNPVMIKILSGYIVEFFFFLSIAFMWVGVSYILPKTPIKAVPIVLILLMIFNMISYYMSYYPTGLNKIGVVDFVYPTVTSMIDAFVILATYGLLGVAFVVNTFKKKYYFLGVLLGIGILIPTIFLPLTYQTEDLGSYYFFSGVAGTGVLMFLFGIFIHPSLAAKKEAQPNQA